MKKFSQKVLTAALVLTLAVPSAIPMAAEGDAPAKLPKPLTWITMMEDNLNENGYENVAGTEVVTDDKMGTVLHVKASTAAEDGKFTDSEAKFKNPLLGQDFEEFDVRQLNEALLAQNEERKENGEAPFLDEDNYPIWYKGVIINYWIKLSGTDNGVVLNFQNRDRMQLHKDDYVKYYFTKWATQAVEDEKAGKEIDPRFVLPESETYVDADNKEYTVFPDAVVKEPDGGPEGSLAAYRPDFPAEAYYVDSKNGTITAHPKAGGADVKLSKVVNTYEGFHDLYADAEGKVLNDKSQIRYTFSDGFLQTSLDGGLCFLEDTYGGAEKNPNRIDPNKATIDVNIRNTAKWTGTSSIMNSLTKANADVENSTWHMVTVKIQNDSVEYYFDGVLFEDIQEFQYWGPFTSTSKGTAVGSSFNGGWGWKKPYGVGFNARVGTNKWYGNITGTLLLDWLSLDNTTFSIGGTNLEKLHDAATEQTAADMLHTERVAEFYIDDLAFYGVELDNPQDNTQVQQWIDQLYDKGLAKMAMENPDEADPVPVPAGNGEVDGQEGITSSDALEVLRFAAKLVEPTAEQEEAADTNLDGKINADDALNILRYAAKLIDTLPVPEE